MAAEPLVAASAADAPFSVSARPVLSLRGIVKSFPGVKALQGVELDLYPGHVTALIGEKTRPILVQDNQMRGEELPVVVRLKKLLLTKPDNLGCRMEDLLTLDGNDPEAIGIPALIAGDVRSDVGPQV